MGDWDDDWDSGWDNSAPAAPPPVQSDFGGSFANDGGQRYDPYPSSFGRGESRRGRARRENWSNGQDDRSNYHSDAPRYPPRERREDGDAVTLTVAREDVGRIIGRGGSKIRELEADSGARIKVTRDEPPQVQLFGSPEQCERARSLITELTQESGFRSGSRGDRGGFRGGRGGRGGWGSDRGGDRDRGGGDQGGRWGGDRSGGRSWRDFGADDDDVGRMSRDRDGHETREFANGTTISTDEDGRTVISVYRDNPGPTANDLFAKLRRMALSDDLGPEWENEPPLIKNFYKEDPGVAAMSAEERDAFYESQNNIMVSELKPSDDKVRNPVRTFEEAWHDHPEILGEIAKQGFERPSPIQCQAWPTLLSGRDFIGIAQTGSGKTLAFLLPAFIHIEGQTKPRAEREGPTVLIMAPTRELALQIQSEVDKYSYRDIRCLCIYGGASRRDQVYAVSDGSLEIVVATPGRLNDLVQARQLSLHDVSYVVLDEADRMLDMGFEPQVVKTLYAVRKDRQTVMTSATWPSGVRRIANEYMRNPVQCVVGTLDLNACHDVTQRVELVAEDEKKNRLRRFIDEEIGEEDKAIIFVGRKLVVDDLVSDLIIAGYPVDAIHGGREQGDRECSLIDFREGRSRLLVATDLASRGLDIVDVTHVFNYDFPRNIEEYVHRVGRTGRAGRSGTAVSLVSREDWRNAAELIKILEEGHQTVPDFLRDMAERFARRQAEGPRRGGGGFRGGGGRGRGGGFRGGSGGGRGRGGFRSDFFVG